MLKYNDPQLYKILNKEKDRQRNGLVMIASENFISKSVFECLSSNIHNTYSEGLPYNRYYSGTEFVDEIEILAQDRALSAFSLDPDIWGVNVQPYSGSIANLAIYMALAKPGGKIMGLNLSDGGHLSHGHKVNFSSVLFQSLSYEVKNDLIDFDDLENKVERFKPDIIIAGTSSYPRALNYNKFSEIAKKNNCFLVADISHISGLIIAGLISSPFEVSDVVMTTTHKTLRGPKGAVIFYKKEIETLINRSVFPGLQGGPHNHTIAGIAAAFLESNSISFRNYQKQIIKNCNVLAKELKKKGYTLYTNGSDCHYIIIKVDKGFEYEKILEKNNIYCNRNSLPGDLSPFKPSGIRLGVQALTSRNMVEKEMIIVATFIDEVIKGKNLKNEIISFSKEFFLPEY